VIGDPSDRVRRAIAERKLAVWKRGTMMVAAASWVRHRGVTENLGSPVQAVEGSARATKSKEGRWTTTC
jgi:hypothetical protein